MKHHLAIDTLKYVKLLEQSGVPREQAEAQSEALSMVLTDYFASKDDLNEVHHELDHRITNVRDELDHRITDVRDELKNDINEVRVEVNELHQDIKSLKINLPKDMTIQMGKMMVGFSAVIIAAVGSIVAFLNYLH